MAPKRTAKPTPIDPEQCRQWLLLRAQKRKLTAEMDAVEAQLKAAMGDKVEHETGIFTLFFPTEEYEGFDSARFKKHHGELASQFTVTKTRRPFNIAVDESALLEKVEL